MEQTCFPNNLFPSFQPKHCFASKPTPSRLHADSMPTLCQLHADSRVLVRVLQGLGFRSLRYHSWCVDSAVCHSSDQIWNHREKLALNISLLRAHRRTKNGSARVKQINRKAATWKHGRRETRRVTWRFAFCVLRFTFYVLAKRKRESRDACRAVFRPVACLRRWVFVYLLTRWYPSFFTRGSTWVLTLKGANPLVQPIIFSFFLFPPLWPSGSRPISYPTTWSS